MKKIFTLLLPLLAMMNILHSKTIVVIGASAAGTSVVKELINNTFDGTIIWITDQKEAPYKTTQIDSYLEGTKSEKDIEIYDIASLPKNVKLLLGKKLIAIDSKSQTITLDDHSKVSYDMLFLGIGAKQSVPKDFINAGEGIFSFSTLSDAHRVKHYLASHTIKNAVVVGLGITGLEVADILSQKGIHVHAVDKNVTILNRYISEMASEFLKKQLQGKITFHCGTQPQKFESANGSVRALILGDGTRISCELVIFTIGSSLNSALFKDTGIKIEDGGIIVDKHMQTTNPNIFAAGDCTLITDLSTGLRKRSGKWKDAEEQGKIAAHAMLGTKKAYSGSHFIMGSHFFGFSFQTYGAVKQHCNGLDVTSYSDGSNYYHLFLRDRDTQILKGYVILDKKLGDRDFLKKAVEQDRPVSVHELQQLHQKGD